MQIIFKRVIFLIGLIILGFTGFSQKVTNPNTCYILSFSPHYSSNLIDLNSNSYDDLFLVCTSKEIKIDNLICSLSKKKYNSLANIIDSLSLSFTVYTIVKDSSMANDNMNKVSKLINDYNNYKVAYSFEMNDTIRKYSSVIGYVIQRFTLNKEIYYRVIKSKQRNYPYELPSAMINKIE